MTDESDDLNRPLGQTKRASRRSRLPVVLSVGALAGMCALGLLIYAFVGPVTGSRTAANKPLATPAGETTRMQPEIVAAQPVSARPEPAPSLPEASAATERTITIIDGTSGERTSVKIPSAAPSERARSKTSEF